ncbi:hypothetical protein M422DRAFT_202405 [Sphaerobolus stellatus SS14]|nr:hypothetical protein M422DRAFT_202405 [Sphaerobolus stellatus SS14]
MSAPSLISTEVLSEQQVIDGFHTFLQTSLAQAKAERLLDTDTLASAEADLMISGPALCLYFGALRSTSDPPTVPLPRSRSDRTLEPLRLSKNTCPAALQPFIEVWSRAVPEIQRLPSVYQHDLARVICGLPQVSEPSNPTVNGLAADLRAIAIEISQRRTFQERYQVDLQYALDAGLEARKTPSNTAHFMPPPMYSEKDTSSTGSRTPEPTTPEPASITFTMPEPEIPSQHRGAGASSGRSHSRSLLADDPGIVLIRETLFASLGDVISKTPTLSAALKTDPARAYFASVALAILDVSLNAITPHGSVLGVLGKELTLADCPVPLRPLMQELGAIGQEAKNYEEIDNESAMKLAARGRNIPEPFMDRVRKILEGGVGYENTRPELGEDSGRRSVEGRAVQFANRVNKLALGMTQLPAFKGYVNSVFGVLSALG